VPEPDGGEIVLVDEHIASDQPLPRCLASISWVASPVTKYSNHPVMSMSRSRTPWIARQKAARSRRAVSAFRGRRQVDPYVLAHLSPLVRFHMTQDVVN